MVTPAKLLAISFTLCLNYADHCCDSPSQDWKPMPALPYKPLTPAERSAKTAGQKAAPKDGQSVLDRALDEPLPGSQGLSASRKKMLDYLNFVLVPALKEIEKRLGFPPSLEISAIDRQKYTFIWGRTSMLAIKLRPNRKESDLDFIHALLRATVVISPKEVRAWEKD